MFFINIYFDGCPFTLVAENDKAVWHVFQAFKRLYATQSIAATMTITGQQGEAYSPCSENRHIPLN